MKITVEERTQIHIEDDDSIYGNLSVQADEWHNGEGWNISIGDNSPFLLHSSEISLLKRAIDEIDRLENGSLNTP